MDKTGIALEVLDAVGGKDNVIASDICMFCPNCGYSVPEGSAFCPNCGTRLVTTPEPTKSRDDASAPIEVVPIQVNPDGSLAHEGKGDAVAQTAPRPIDYTQTMPAPDVRPQQSQPSAADQAPPAPIEHAQTQTGYANTQTIYTGTRKKTSVGLIVGIVAAVMVKMTRPIRPQVKDHDVLLVYPYESMLLSPTADVAAATSFVETTDVEFYHLTDEEIRAYAVSGEPLDKAGAYGIQGRGGLLVHEVYRQGRQEDRRPSRR